jgi:hypothetical protein
MVGVKHQGLLPLIRFSAGPDTEDRKQKKGNHQYKQIPAQAPRHAAAVQFGNRQVSGSVHRHHFLFLLKKEAFSVTYTS